MTIVTSPTAPFLAPFSANEDRPQSAASDCGEAAMYRLRHPFSIAAPAQREASARGSADSRRRGTPA
jgi:hypothetical protein